MVFLFWHFWAKTCIFCDSARIAFALCTRHRRYVATLNTPHRRHTVQNLLQKQIYSLVDLRKSVYPSCNFITLVYYQLKKQGVTFESPTGLGPSGVHNRIKKKVPKVYMKEVPNKVDQFGSSLDCYACYLAWLLSSLLLCMDLSDGQSQGCGLVHMFHKDCHFFFGMAASPCALTLLFVIGPYCV